MNFDHENNTNYMSDIKLKPTQHQPNRDYSREAYSLLMAGKMINATDYRQGSISSNPIYQELFNGYEYYAQMYDNIGFELIMGEHFFYIKKYNELSNDLTNRIYALLVIVGFGVMKMGYDFDILTDHEAGIADKVLRELQQQLAPDLLTACQLSQNLDDDIQNLLVDRALMYKNGLGNFVLSDAGKAFFQQVFDDNNQQLDSEELFGTSTKSIDEST